MRRNRRIGSAQTSEFGAALAVFFLFLFFPLLNLACLTTGAATAYMAATESARRAGDSTNYMEALAAAEAAAQNINSSGFAQFARLKPIGGYNGSGMNLYLTDTNINTGVSLSHGPNTPAVSAYDLQNYLYSYDAVVRYDVGPFLNLSAVPYIGSVPGLGAPMRVSFLSSRNVEHLEGVTVAGGGFVLGGNGGTTSSTISGASANSAGGTTSGVSSGAPAVASAAGTGSGQPMIQASPSKPWQVATTNGVDRFIPNEFSSFHVQLTGTVDFNVARDVFDVDLYATTAADVATIHANGGYAIAYMNTGAWQPGMPDSDLYPPSVIGTTPMSGWPEERWLDIRQIAILRPIIQQKLQLAKSMGFDAVDPDNMDGFTNTTDFGLTAADQLAFNIMVAEEAHAIGLAVFLKNTAGDLVNELEPYYDGSVAEQMFKYKEAFRYQPFRDSHKPVFAIEYGKVSKKNLAEAVQRGFNVAKAKRQLNGATKMLTSYP